MNLSTVYSKTGKGARALASKSRALPTNAMRVLAQIDGTANAEAVRTEFEKLTDHQFKEILTQLEEEGYIRAITDDSMLEFSSDFDIQSSIVVSEISAEEFLKIEAAADDTDSSKKERELREAQARAKAYAEEQQKLEAAAREQEESERTLLKVTNILAKSGHRLDIEKLATKEPVLTEAEQKALEEAEARIKANEARTQRETEAKARARAERKAREAESLAKAEAEVQAKRESERKSREEAEARTKAEAEEKARIEAERKAREEAEALAKAEAQTKTDPEAQAKREAEALARAEAERKAREEAEAQAKAKALEAVEKARIEAERRAREEAEALAKAEARAKAEAEAQAKREAEALARAEAERKAREEAEALAKAKAEEKARIEAEAQAKREAEALARAEAERKAREIAEAEAKAKAEEKARIEAERKAREEAEALAKAEARAKAEAEAQAKREAEALARAEAERKAREEAEARARLKAEEKARIEAERKARKLVEAEMKAEAKLQAKRDAEARALLKAEEKAKRRQARGTVDINKWLYGSVSAARNLLISLLIITVALIALLHLVNLSMLQSPIEKIAAESINEPVSVKEVHFSLWPSPHLVLETVTIGRLSDVKAATISVFPVLSTIFDDVKILKSIEIEELTLDQRSLDRPLKWVSSSTKRAILKVDQIHLEKTELKLDGLNLSPFNANIRLTSSGELKFATLNADDRSIAIEIFPKNDIFEINVSANEWQPPLGPHIVFDELSAKGVADHDKIDFPQIEGSLYGGSIKGRMTVNWADLWTANGNFELAKISLQDITPVMSGSANLNGRLDTTATFSLKASEFAKLAETPDINARFEVLSGYIGGADLVRAIQSSGRNPASGGSTRFDKVSGSMSLEDGQYRFRQLTLKAGQLRAYGEFDVLPNQDISGKINSDLALSSRQLHSRFNLTGKVARPRLD